MITLDRAIARSSLISFGFFVHFHSLPDSAFGSGFKTGVKLFREVLFHVFRFELA
jgi:hypothetical protein